MAAPNIVNVSTITGKTTPLILTTSNQDIVTNAASSGKVYKINSLIVSNVNGSAAAQVTASIIRSSTAYMLASTIYVPANSTLVIISKDMTIYLEEGDVLRIIASANNYLHAVASYEIIS
jgi:hypothetical protein